MVGERIVSAPWFEYLIKVLVVLLLPWAIWTTTNIYDVKAFVGRGDRFTDVDALKLESRMRILLHAAEVRIDSRIDLLPPLEYRNKLEETRDDIRNVERQLSKFEREFSSAFVRKDEVNIPPFHRHEKPEVQQP